MSAQYLLRFDDLCPTMDRRRWERFLPLMAKHGIRPILAVVPENRDPELEVAPPDGGFWDEMRELEAAGATIGLHGYEHLCQAEGPGLLPLHRLTEFAGAPEDCQREWIRRGLKILRGHGLNPRIWVAPRHGLDRVTLSVLRDVELDLVSDGFAKRPFVDGGVCWIPQQLWKPMEKKAGLWTICVHSNSATDEFVQRLESFAGRFGTQFTSVDRVVEEWPVAERGLADRVFHVGTMARIRLANLGRRLWKG